MTECLCILTVPFHLFLFIFVVHVSVYIVMKSFHYILIIKMTVVMSIFMSLLYAVYSMKLSYITVFIVVRCVTSHPNYFTLSKYSKIIDIFF